MAKTVLITGATGLIGNYLTGALLERGHTVRHLSRKPNGTIRGVEVFKWDPGKMEIDESCIANVDAIINLAGEPIAGKSWSSERKQQILKSRTDALELMYTLLKKRSEHRIETFISASAVGIYGDRRDDLLTENSQPGTDFLATTCLAWEQAADKIGDLVARLVKFRIGVVLSGDGGALPTIAKPVRFGLGAALGSGKQWVPWIHIHDVANMFLHSLENTELSGVYNMTAPRPVTNKELTKAIATQLKKPLLLPRVPPAALQLLMGEMSQIVLSSNKTSADKILSTGFKFKYPELETALSEIYA